MAVLDGTEQGQQRPLILTLKDKKDEFTKGVCSSVVDEGSGMWRGMQDDRTWHTRHAGCSESLG